MPSTTDVRQWARENGYAIGDRGAVPGDVREAYDQAHRGPVIDGAAHGVLGAPGDEDFPGPDDPDPGELIGQGADVTAAPAPPPPPAPPAPAGDGPAPGEKAPRKVGRSRGRGRSRFPKWFGARKTRRGRGRGSIPRASLGDFAEETWMDLAWLAAPIPPLAMMLELQAPYAGVVLDDQVSGTVIDDLLQPVARYSGAFRALNGLMGPPVSVLLICLEGRRDEETGEFDGRTKMMFGMLRYSLAQMLRVSEVSQSAIEERATAIAERGKVVDGIVNRLFGLVPDQPRDGAPPPPQAPGGAPPPPRQYPGAPSMDATGADPARAG